MLIASAFLVVAQDRIDIAAVTPDTETQTPGLAAERHGGRHRRHRRGVVRRGGPGTEPLQQHRWSSDVRRLHADPQPLAAGCAVMSFDPEGQPTEARVTDFVRQARLGNTIPADASRLKGCGGTSCRRFATDRFPHHARRMRDPA